MRQSSWKNEGGKKIWRVVLWKWALFTAFITDFTTLGYFLSSNWSHGLPWPELNSDPDLTTNLYRRFALRYVESGGLVLECSMLFHRYQQKSSQRRNSTTTFSRDQLQRHNRIPTLVNRSLVYSKLFTLKGGGSFVVQVLEIEWRRYLPEILQIWHSMIPYYEWKD